MTSRDVIEEHGNICKVIKPSVQCQVTQMKNNRMLKVYCEDELLINGEGYNVNGKWTHNVEVGSFVPKPKHH